MKKITLSIICVFTLYCCNNKKKDITKTNSKTENMKIIDILKIQLKDGAPDVNNSYDYSLLDLEAIIPETKKILLTQNYKTLSNEIFNAKINSIFKRVIDPKLDSKYLYIDFLDKCNRIPKYFLTNYIDYYGLFVVKNENYITENFAIPQILDYQNEFPNIDEYESKFANTYDEQGLNNENSIFLWKEVKNLTQQRQKNIQILVARNKYLFNDSPADFVWLCFNDEYFLQSLVKTFGYVEDEELNKFVLDKNLKEDEEFGKVIWNKDCSGKINFNLNIFETIKKASKGDQEKYFNAINNYLSYFGNTPNNYLDLTFSEKAEIKGKIAYYATKIVGRESDYYFKLFTYVNSEEYQKEFEKQNYYKIKDFKEIYFETKTGGVAYPGMIE